MNFRPELAAKVMAGEKTVTRRIMSENPRSPWYHGGCKLRPYRSYAVCPGRGKNAIGRVIVKSVRREWLHELTEREAVAEGFDSIEDFFDAFREINSRAGGNGNMRVWRVGFAVDSDA